MLKQFDCTYTRNILLKTNAGSPSTKLLKLNKKLIGKYSVFHSIVNGNFKSLLSINIEKQWHY